MDTQIVVVFCLCDDLLKAHGHRQDAQCRMSDAEVLTTAIVAMLFFGGNYSLARCFLKEQGYRPDMLGKSRFSRRLHRIKPMLVTLFELLSMHWKASNPEQIYALDTFPIPVCDNYRIRWARFYRQERYRGYIASKRRFFYGLKLHLLVTEQGQPVEFFLTPGNCYDNQGLAWFRFDLPEGSLITADKAYNDRRKEQELAECGLHLYPFRKKNSKQPYAPWFNYLLFHYRKMVETTGSLIHRLLPRKIHATSALGFELKIVLFVLACSINFLF